MHPEDVEEFVAESVAVLAHKLEQHHGLAGRPELVGTSLDIPFQKVQRTLVDHAVNTGVVLPGGGGAAIIHRVPLLGQPPSVRDLVLHMDLDGYDSQPPTAELLLPDRTPLPAAEWPKSINGQGIVADHKEYGRPFFCRRGLREYHSHPQHEDDPWDRYREGLALHMIALELLRGLRDTWIGR